METVQKAGVDFNPDTRTVTAIQGDAASGSPLEVISKHSFTHVIHGLSVQPEMSALA